MIIPFGFDFVLLIVCTYYAVKTRWADNTLKYNTENLSYGHDGSIFLLLILNSKVHNRILFAITTGAAPLFT